MTPAKRWVHRLMISSSRFTAPNGDVFQARNLPIGNGPFWGSKGFECSINGVACGAAEFEARLAEHYPKEIPSLREMIEQSKKSPRGLYSLDVTINRQPHLLGIEWRPPKLIFKLDYVQIPLREFDRYLRSSSLTNGTGKPVE